MVGVAKDRPEFQAVYAWVDGVALSRKRKGNFARDFSDGCLTAEVIKHHAGGRFAVDLHNYSEALSGPRKRDNWNLLHEKVLRKHLGIRLDKTQIEALCSATEGAAERLLADIKAKIEAGGGAPPVRKRLEPPPEPPVPQKGAKGKPPGKENEAGGAPRAISPAPAGPVGRRGGAREHKESPVLDGHGRQGSESEPAQKPQYLGHAPGNGPHPNPAVHDRGGIAGGAGREWLGVPRASSASKAVARVSPQMRELPGPAGRGRKSREWWGESSQNVSWADDSFGYGAQGGGFGGLDGGFGGALDNLLELAQGDLKQFDMRYQMHLKAARVGGVEGEAGERESSTHKLPAVKGAHKKKNDKGAGLGHQVKGSPLIMLAERGACEESPSKAARRGAVEVDRGRRDASPVKGKGSGGAKKGKHDASENAAKREGRRQAWAELEREAGLPADDGADLVQECDLVLDGVRGAHSALEIAIKKLENAARERAVEGCGPGVDELGAIVGAANARMARKARSQNAGDAPGHEGAGPWGMREIDVFQELGPHYRAAEEGLPGQGGMGGAGQLSQMRELELLGLNRMAGGGPGGAPGIGMGQGWGEFRKVHGEIQNYPWFNPYLPKVAPGTPGPSNPTPLS